MIIKQQNWAKHSVGASHHTANQLSTDLLYYFSIGYYYWIRFKLS